MIKKSISPAVRWSAQSRYARKQQDALQREPLMLEKALALSSALFRVTLTLINKFFVCLAPTDPTSSMANPACMTGRAVYGVHPMTKRSDDQQRLASNGRLGQSEYIAALVGRRSNQTTLPNAVRLVSSRSRLMAGLTPDN